ncbi:UDP-glycosyltransferase [Melia azedarach]|uniref:UDP-glycosyltransferase n=1 Tax=Melia azedarach TaxID=155640 RepID=A0ACC1YSA2_MELAZ|nr:UDP-glycosyltransferase [Melia azedarach]
MDQCKKESAGRFCHAVALPFPGRGHINPMMNLCILLVSRKPDIVITFVLTEEWLGLVGSSVKKPENIRFETVPNVIPSEFVRARDFPAFLEAVSTKMEAPFEKVLDRLHLEAPMTVIIADTFLTWAVDVGNRRNIPVASFWTMSASVFSVFHHFELLERNGHFPVELSERGEELVDYIPGLPSTRVADLPTIFFGIGRRTLPRALESVSGVAKAQYFILSSVYELEVKVIDTLNSELPIPVYPIGPTIPYFDVEDITSRTTSLHVPNYFEWLDSQPIGSVLYVSLGSFLSVSSVQMDEIVAGVRNSGVRYLWVTRGDTSRFNDGCLNMGIVVPWCDQLKVLSHSSIGGFWTHCGWNSILEALYAGVPMLTFSITMDQNPNSKLIVEDLKIGWRVKRSEAESESLVTRNEILELVKRFMDLDSDERKQMSKRAGELKEICREAVAEGGPSITNLDALLKDISLA